MSKKVLIRKQVGTGGIMYTRDVGRGQGGGFMGDLAAVRGGARGLNAQGRQSFIPGAQLGDAKPTGMQRLAAGANIAGRGLAAALTGLQTAYGLQGGNVGALGSVGDTYAQNVQGLTANRPTEAQQAQDMATEAFNQQQQTMAQNAVQQSAQQIMNQPVNVGSSSSRGPAPAGLPTQQPTQPPAGLPTPIVPPADPMQQMLPMGQPVAQPAAQPAASGQQVSPEMVQATAQTSVPMQPPAPAAPAPTPAAPASAAPASAAPTAPASDPGVDHQNLTIDGIRFGSQSAFDMALQRRMNRSFATYVLNEFGDMLHKADPHVAGLLAFRVYMDKVMR